VPGHLDRYERPLLAGWIARGGEEAGEWLEVVVTPPTELVGDRHSLDLGDRVVEMLHLGRGHTDNDLLLHIPDAGAWLLGDVIEESGPPCYGSGCFPLDWPVTVNRLLALLAAGDVLVPGHGQPVGKPFVLAQQEQLARVADLIREIYDGGVLAGKAIAAGGDGWALPVDGLAPAIEEGYAQLSRGERGDGP
jgi:glyoxylase-like metal-dependent hydrolase (beta-lactamase superfamily II)